MEVEKPSVPQRDLPDYIRSLGVAGIERRYTAAAGIQLRAAGKEGEPRVFVGYGLKFNTLSEDFGGWRERIMPGFLDNVLGQDIRILRDHIPSLILGRTKSGTAKVGVDATGGWYEFTDPETTYSRDLAISITRSDVDQSSFAFSLAANGDKWERQKDGTYLRTLLAAENLYDMSPVTYPAYADTSIAERTFKKIQIPDGIIDAVSELDMLDSDMKRTRLRIRI